MSNAVCGGLMEMKMKYTSLCSLNIKMPQLIKEKCILFEIKHVNQQTWTNMEVMPSLHI
jgi:hypothetical protein